MAIASGRVRTDIVGAGEFPEVARRYGVYAVPKTVINEQHEVMGAVPEAELVKALVSALGDGDKPEAPLPARPGV